MGTAAQVCVLGGGWNALVIPHVASCYTHPVVSLQQILDLSHVRLIPLTCKKKRVCSQNRDDLQPVLKLHRLRCVSSRPRFCWTAARTTSVFPT